MASGEKHARRPRRRKGAPCTPDPIPEAILGPEVLGDIGTEEVEAADAPRSSTTMNHTCWLSEDKISSLRLRNVSSD
jgi:hypothetical protein